MINFLIWSKDRACQLDYLIKSIRKNVLNSEYKITILFTTSSDEFCLGYNILKSRYPDCDFVFEEKMFSEHTIEIVKYHKYTILSTDDTIIYREIDNLNNVVDFAMSMTDVFSLRYGLNTVMQDIYNNQYQPRLRRPIRFLEGKIISWNWSDYSPHDNYGYPFGLDMHCYKSSQLAELMSAIEFKNPNQLETGLFYLKHKIKHSIFSFAQSVAFNNPINNMSKVTIAGQFFPSSIEDLNKKFLEGYSIEYIYNITDIVGCHQEVQATFVKES